MMALKCSIVGCERPIKVASKQLCHPCYYRYRRQLFDPPSREELLSRLMRSIVVTDSADQCWEWQEATIQGYGRFTMRGKMFTAHRVAFFVQNGYWAKKMTLHKCGNRKCCNYHHLYEGTAKQNAVDRTGHGTQVRGSMAWNAKLNENQVREIKNFLRDGIKPGRLATLCGVSTKTIQQIKTGISWVHIVYAIVTSIIPFAWS